MDGVALASRYAYPPNRKGYCGAGSYGSILRGFMCGRESGSGLRSELERFRAHHAYLALIARENGLEPFDRDVVRAFWTGNRLLEGVRPASLRSFILGELIPRSQRARARRLCDSLPEGILPHHSFNVLYVNFVSNAVERSIRNFDSCCVTSGKVLAASGSSARIMRNSIGYDGGFGIVPRQSTVALERGGIRFIKNLKAGDTVSVHWGMAIEKLSAKGERALMEYTNKNIRAINDSGALRKCEK
jgi:hydrogenase maturation factor